MRTKRKTLHVVGALIFAAFALLAVGCGDGFSTKLPAVQQPGQGEMFTGG